jgi:hypothetical protein
MHEDELLAVYRRHYTAFRHVDHREYLESYHRSLRRAGWGVAEAQGKGGYAVITGVTRGRITEGTPPQYPPFATGEILVLERIDGKEVRASGRERNPSKWAGLVHYSWAEGEDAYSKALTIAISWAQAQAAEQQPGHEVAPGGAGE